MRQSAINAIAWILVGGFALGGQSDGDSGGGKALQLSRVRHEAREYIDSLQMPGKPCGWYRDHRSKEPLLYPSCDVAILRAIMGEDLQQTLTADERRQWIDHVNSFAQPDGTYSGRRENQSVEHANGMVIGALGVLGGRQKHVVQLYRGFDSLEKIGPWLERMDWQRQWGGSHLFWGGMHCFGLSGHCTPAWRRSVFTWLDANLDPRTGWWRKGVSAASPIEPLGGGAHIWPVYQHHGQRFPYPERVIDSILSLQRADGCWLSYGNYMELDALYGLIFMRSLAPAYRSQDIIRAVHKHGQALWRRWPRLLADKPDLHVLLGIVGAFGLLNQLSPEAYADSAAWTDIFSDRRLYRVREVEVLEEQ